MKLTRMLRGGNDNVSRRVASLSAHLCKSPAGWSGFDTIEPARWVGGTGATIVVPTNNPQGVEAGSDDSRIGGWPRSRTEPFSNVVPR